MKKIKKIYKPQNTLAQNLSFNKKITTWRQIEMKKRKSYSLFYTSALIFQTLWKDNTFVAQNDVFTKINIQFLKWNLNKYASNSKLKTYCHYIGRSRSVNNKLYMARHTLRKFVRFGMLPGFIKEF